MTKNLSILGSTGSIGTQSLETARKCGYSVSALSAYSNVDLIEEQIREFKPKIAALVDENAAKELKNRVADTDTKVLSGIDGVCECAGTDEADTVINSVVGMAGLKPTLTAIDANKKIALANKETLVAGGLLVTTKAREKGVDILPVDSEHSAIFQCLAGEANNPIEKLLLTASGGPFRTWSMEQLQYATREQALKHPNWEMGAKITIDSASMMNKGFEVIEAKWLFDVNPSQIEVVVHPQSVIHSMVQFADGSVKAQLGTPDMRLPIQYAFSYPYRLPLTTERLDFSKLSSLTFEQPDPVRFRNLALSFEALKCGGNMPCILNAANEVCVAAFLKERIGFLQMSDIIERTMQKVDFIKHPNYDDYVATDTIARRVAEEFINNKH